MSGYDESLRVERTRDYVRLNKIQKKDDYMMNSV